MKALTIYFSNARLEYSSSKACGLPAAARKPQACSGASQADLSHYMAVKLAHDWCRQLLPLLLMRMTMMRMTTMMRMR